MRFLSTIMLLIVIGLSVVPCCSPIAKSNLQNWAKIESSCCDEDNCDNSEIPAPSSKNESNCNSCSPFFSCGTCSGFTAPTNLLDLTHRLFLLQNTYSNFELQIHSEFFETKWQPPKIS